MVRYEEPKSWDEPSSVDVVVLGASAGGYQSLSTIVSHLPRDFPAAMLIAQHRAGPAQRLVELLRRHTVLDAREAASGDRVVPGTVYVAPSGRQMVMNRDGTLCTCSEIRINHVRPCIDALLASLAVSHGGHVVAVVLSGAGRDGACGIQAVRAQGGYVIAEALATAEFVSMPRAAIDTRKVDLVLPLQDIAPALQTLVGTCGKIGHHRLDGEMIGPVAAAREVAATR